MKGRKRNRCAPGNAICPIHRLPAHIPSGDLFGVVIPLRCITGPGDGFRHPQEYGLCARNAGAHQRRAAEGGVYPDGGRRQAERDGKGTARESGHENPVERQQVHQKRRPLYVSREVYQCKADRGLGITRYTFPSTKPCRDSSLSFAHDDGRGDTKK